MGCSDVLNRLSQKQKKRPIRRHICTCVCMCVQYFLYLLFCSPPIILCVHCLATWVLRLPMFPCKACSFDRQNDAVPPQTSSTIRTQTNATQTYSTAFHKAKLSSRKVISLLPHRRKTKGICLFKANKKQKELHYQTAHICIFCRNTATPTSVPIQHESPPIFFV